MGRFPDNIFHLPNLQLLEVGYNYNLTGSLPTYNWSTPLKSLGLSSTGFPIDIPNSISNLKSLKDLSLRNCSFIGSSHPTFLSNLTQITSLDLSYNNFGGQCPWSLLNNAGLTLLDLSGNNFIGQLPNLSANWTKVSSSNSSSNSQSVSQIPSNLVYLDLSHNLLNGTIPSWVYDIPSLQELFLDNNQFTGHIGEFLHNSLVDLLLSNNKLHGPLPLSISKLDTFRGRTWDIRSNLLQGPLPIPPLGISFFSVARNKITGQISSLICNLSSIVYLDLSYNHLSNMIPPCFGNFSDNLMDLNLQNNNLNGTLPTKFAKGCRLRSLKLNGNQFEGSLPQSLVLILRSNNFHGALGNPKTKFPFPNLRIIDLSHNEFHGHLPTNLFKYLKAMMNVSADKGELKYMGDNYYQDSVTVVMKGFFFDLVKIQSLFTTIDFSNNNFKGEIPKVIGELRSLKGLNFSHNNLTGCMPQSLGNLTNLEWLDLSSNKLTGEIPIQLVDLTMLAFLNLSENYLFGHIPQGKQFNTFMNDSYYGNRGLCGFPITKACGNDEGQQPSPSSTIQEDDFEFEKGFHWKVVLLGYGCGFMFGLGLGYLVFSSGKPKWLVNIVYGGRHNKLQRS
uniref:Receptor-like protein 12 n=2 Tax=Quercus lobata TaxID=97700 RepID=A0A7N2N0S7_QUELO